MDICDFNLMNSGFHETFDTLVHIPQKNFIVQDVAIQRKYLVQS